MSILIKGMKMPTSCMDCPFKGFDRAGGRGNICTINDSITLHAVLGGFDVKFVRTGDCPLIAVPPHGRLIDADALRQSIKESIDECHKWANEVEGGEMYARVSQSLGTFVECSLRVKAAPTIIPAEEAKG